jgi:hypothetical protein
VTTQKRRRDDFTVTPRVDAALHATEWARHDRSVARAGGSPVVARRIVAALVVVAAAAAASVAYGAAVGRPEASGAVDARASSDGPPLQRHGTPTPTPTPAARSTAPAADEAAYDLSALPVVDVFSVIPALPVDDDPFGSTTDVVVRPAAAAIPVFAAPGSPPVAALPRDQRYGGSAVPVIAEAGDWLEVLLVGRHGVPPTGDSHQTYGWLRRADVTASVVDVSVSVSISARTIDIVRPGGAERVASDFAWGAPATPSPLGRTFVMMTAMTTFAYARGHPIVYLATQSPTLGAYGGVSVAVTAFHYYDIHSGPVSDGCIQVDAAAIGALDALPDGTVVYIRP